MLFSSATRECGRWNCPGPVPALPHSRTFLPSAVYSTTRALATIWRKRRRTIVRWARDHTGSENLRCRWDPRRPDPIVSGYGDAGSGAERREKDQDMPVQHGHCEKTPETLQQRKRKLTTNSFIPICCEKYKAYGETLSFLEISRADIESTSWR